MAYDGLDRLTHVSSPMFGTANYGYDPQDNLTSVNLSGGSHARQHDYCYNTRNQLEFIRTGAACSGTTSPAAVALGYDVQGNVSYKNGSSYSFDDGNRLRSTAGQSYRYDADGRRVRQDNAGTQLKYSYYAKDGRLLAEITRPIGNTTATISYFHTDALGSPIAKTNAAGAIIETSEYEPYGRLLNRNNDDRAGYTGHVMDAVSGLTYMQQRYYDPGIGMMLSRDPVTAYSTGDMRLFNGYAYAFNNPYKFTDPDGRIGVVGFLIGAGIDASLQVAGSMRSGQSFGEAVSNVDVGSVVVAGAVSAIIPGLGNVAKAGYQGAKAAVPAARAIANAGAKSANTANRAAKNAEIVARNIAKIEGAAADVGKATTTAATHQIVKADVQSRTPEVKASDVRNVVAPPPPPPDPKRNN